MSLASSDVTAVSPQHPQKKWLGLVPIRTRPPGFAEGKTIPERRVNVVSQTLFSWLTPLIVVGYSRPLEIEDLWELTDEYDATRLGTSLEEQFYKRVPPAKRPLHLRPALTQADLDALEEERVLEREKKEAASMDGEKDGLDGLSSLETEKEKAQPGDKGEKDGQKKPKEKKESIMPPKVVVDGKTYDQNIVLALQQVIFWRFWSAGIFGLFGNALTASSPLVSRVLLSYITNSYNYANGLSATPPGGIGIGIGATFGLWGMQQVASILMNQFLQRSLVTGFMCRAAVISTIARKSLRLSAEGRQRHSNGQLITHISADASFLDWCFLLLHDVYLQPLMIIIGLAILLHTIGYSALVGLAVLLLGIPIQGYLFSVLIGTRQEQMKITDKRVRLLTEILQGIRVIKLMAYEEIFGDRVSDYRRQELRKLTRNCLARACMSSIMAFIPVAAAVLSFITYSLSGHDLNVAIIFSALQAFNNIRQPLFILPLAFQALSDAFVGLGRISTLMLAPELENAIPIDPTAEFAISVHADFAWDFAEKPGDSNDSGKMGRDRGAAKRKKAEKKAAQKAKKAAATSTAPTGTSTPVPPAGPPAAPFALKDIHLEVPRGAFCVVVGQVGSGKSSLVQALIGEMRLSKGEAYLGGSTSYFQQSPWVQNATLRDNIIFGDPSPDEERFRAAITACALEPDVAMLADGLNTEIGERGINLSGGQKARVCLARAVYASSADIIFMDDPLSAVDAHVSKTLVECMTDGPLKDKTRFLVTHHLDVLPLADLIVTMVDGRIAETGTYAELMLADGALAKLVAEHVSEHDKPALEAGAVETTEDLELKEVEIETKVGADTDLEKGKTKPEAGPAGLMLKEERALGAVSGKIYGQYISSMGQFWRAPIFLGALLLAQAANVGTSVFLGFWSSNRVAGWSQGQYMALYAGLGISYSIMTFIGTFVLFLSGVRASFRLFNLAFAGVMGTNVAWHDGTPIGRVTSRLSKDITVLDDQLPMQWNQLLQQGLNVVGTVALVFYSFPLLGIIFVPLFLLYYGAADVYRHSSREVTRLDSLMRSFVYASFGEMLSGMASIRAYHAQDRFITKTETDLNKQNRAYFTKITLQRWLGVRLDALGNVLVLAIGLFGVGFRLKTEPYKLGVVLTYSLTLTQIFSQLVNVFAQVEQDMNTAERVIHYGNLEPEAAKTRPDDPPKSWPEHGAVMFDNVELKYRPDLPAVLKGTSFAIRAGENVGIVGRTGAGKSSLLQALFRMVELSGGSITIDGFDLSKVGLDTLRRALGIVPQDALLWAGTVRENLDPEATHTDAELNDALRRCNLIGHDDVTSEIKARLAKFKLDAVIADEGGNFSAGERQLLALARVLVRNSRVLLLDEATSSVDVETDAAIQNVIKTEFRHNTLITVAHRLATIAFYDRVLVMDQGVVAEFDAPLTLFDQEGSIFRSMCDKASLSREDIVRIRGGP